MRRIVYSGFVKFIAVLLFIASIVSGVLLAANGIFAYFGEDEEVYTFEKDFSQSWYIRSLLDTPEYMMLGVYQDIFYEYDLYYEYDEYGRQNPQNVKDDEQLRAEMESKLTETFGNGDNFESIQYFVQWNDLVFTNCDAKSGRDLTGNAYYSFFKWDSSGQTEYTSTCDTGSAMGYLLERIQRLDSESTIEIACSVKAEAAAEYKAIWDAQQAIVIDTILKVLICAGAALLSLIYLLCVCGKNKDGEYKNMWLDKIWLELHLAAMAAAGVGAVALCIYIAEEFTYGNFPQNLILLALGIVTGLGSLILITSLLSMIRNIKTGRLIESSLILSAARWAIRLLIKAIKWIWKGIKSFWTMIGRLLSKKTGVIFIAGLFGYTMLIGFFGVGTIYSPLWLLIGIALFVLVCFMVACRARDLDEIKQGVSQVRNGNVGYKIPQLKCSDLQTLAGNINDLARGLDESVAAQVRAERMKIELITNVSHDLNTPITSIINFTELLSKMEELPEDAKHYVAIIAKKSDRLRTLTRDLFDISKVQSGNEDITFEKLDVALLIGQALGEHDNEIQSSGLIFCVKAPKELYISADGRKLSRVLSNLISNIFKYTLKNTRVFITASEKDGFVEMEFKNISAYPLDFDVEEITHRFVRGDESRTAEGNGLGLAIAKSYTEVCNGTFEIVADGDMFKAILRFRKFS